MKNAVKSTLAGAAIIAAATVGAPMSHADDADTGSAKPNGSYGSHYGQREFAKHEPGKKMQRGWGPSQATSSSWGPSQFGG